MQKHSVYKQSYRYTRRQLLRGAIGGSAGVAGLWLLACGTSNNNGSNKPANAAVTTTATATTAAGRAAGTAAPAAAGTGAPAGSPAAAATLTPKRGGVLRQAQATKTPHQDPNKISSAGVNGPGVGMAYSGLVRPQSYGHGNKIIPAGDLAESWQQPDATTFIFKLRQGAKFHNVAPVNGRVATAADVVYSWKRQIAEKVNAANYGNVTNVEAVDPATVKITLDSPNVDFLPAFTDEHNKILAHEAVELRGDLTNGPTIGTGPWIFKELQPDVLTAMVRNPDYFLPGIPYADEFDQLILGDPTAIEVQFLAGKITWVGIGSGLAKATADGLDNKKYQSFKSAPAPYLEVLFNINNQGTVPQLKDVRIRRALNMAIDPTLVVNNVLDGLGQQDAIGAVLPSPDWALPSEQLSKYDPQAAKQLLQAAGGLTGQTLHVLNFPQQASYGTLVQAAWKAIGADTTIKLIDSVELTGSVFNPAVANYAFCATSIIHTGTFTNDLQGWYKTGGAFNSGKISDAQLDQLIQAQKQEGDLNKRKGLVQQIQKLIIDQAYYAGFVASVTVTVSPVSVHNLEPLSGIFTTNYLAEIWQG